MAERSKALDGLRGTAAMTVTAFHFFSAYLPGMLSEETQHPWWGSDLPIAIFYNGNFAVSVFFVISGFVIAESAVKHKRHFFVSVVQRYFRLAIPVLAGTLFGWTLLAIFPGTVAALKANNDHTWLMWVYDGSEPGILSAVKDGLYDVFRTGGSRFDNVLWTMRIELFGSIIVYAIYIVSNSRLRLIVLVAATVLLLPRPEYMAFCCGALLREALLHKLGPMPNWQSWLLFGTSLVTGALMPGYGDRIGLPHLPPLIALGEPHKLVAVAAATILVFTLKVNPFLHKLFSTKMLVWIGSISFGLYLVHVPLLYTIFAPFFLSLKSSVLGMSFLFILFVATALAIGAAFTLAIDRPTLALLPVIRIIPAYMHARCLSLINGKASINVPPVPK